MIYDQQKQLCVYTVQFVNTYEKLQNFVQNPLIVMKIPKLIEKPLQISILLLLLITLKHCSQQLQILQIQSAPQQQPQWSNISNPEAYQRLNRQLQSVDDSFITHFLSYYHIQKIRFLQVLNDESMAPNLQLSNIKLNPGNYLLLLGKMYLYDMMPKSQITGFTWTIYKSQSRYLLAYFYLKIAAERYENPQAYYYLAVLDYYKINPHDIVVKNLEKQIKNLEIETKNFKKQINNLEKQIDLMSQQQGYDQKEKNNFEKDRNKLSQKQKYNQAQSLFYTQLLNYLQNQRFISVQQNLFLSSVIGHHGASLTLASMYKQGIGLQKNYKNCTTALSYYLSVIRDTYVDHYQFRSSYSDDKNFEKQLYAKRRVVFENQQNLDVVSDSEFFDSETIKAIYQLADNYFIGKNGFRKNYVKAAQLYAKLAAHDHKNSMSMLGMCYFKGQGVSLDRKRARVLFQHSSKVSISQAMLIVMDYFEIESNGQRVNAVAKMKQIYDKKKDNMNTILKYLFASVILKGDVPTLKADDAVLLMGSAAKEGHLMAKISMGLLFADGIDVNYDCARTVGYFYEQSSSHPFFMVIFVDMVQDKFYVARFGLKKELFTFSLIKYLQLSMIGDTNSFINALYILQIENQKSLNMNIKSWSLTTASQNPLYLLLKQQKIVPDLFTYFQKQYSFVNHKPMKFATLSQIFQSNPTVFQQHLSYMKKKIIKVCAVTKDNSLMHFYDYKMTQKEDAIRLNTIANGSPMKLHVLQTRYLLGQLYHKRAFRAKQQGKDHTKDQYNSLQEYKRATSSPMLGKLLFYFEQIMLNPQGIDFEDDLFEFGFINDFLTFTFVLSILVFVLYYKRSKKLDEIHRKELEKTQAEIKGKQQQEFPRRFQNLANQQIESSSQQKQIQPKILNIIQNKDQNQPQIFEQRPLSGHRIGSSLQEDDHLVLRQYEQYKFQEAPIKHQETNLQKDQNNQRDLQKNKEKEE